MLIEPKKLSALIREKKKLAAQAQPALVHTDARPDLDPMDMYNMQQQGRIEATIESPHKINAEETAIMENDGKDGNNIGVTPEEKKRMARLHAYFDTIDLSA
jgi:hypothetical protein